MATYTLLEKISVGAAGASSVTFSSIPQTGYTDLVVKVSTRTTYAGEPESIYIYPNGSGSNGTRRALYGTGSAAGSDSASNIRLDYLNGNTSTSNTFGTGEIYIPNYTSSNYKSMSMEAVSENNGSAAYQGMSAGLWSNTAAITSLQLTPLNGNFMQYSTFYLYGVAKLGTTPTIAPKATGGDTIMTDGTYWYHAFKASGTFTPSAALSCDVLVVAGGGGGGHAGGNRGGGGAGAGGLLGYSSQSLTGGTPLTVTVGAGGASKTQGSNSQFAALTASVGGGKGESPNNAGGNGGSGGGASVGSGGTATSGQGFNGGSGYSPGGSQDAGGGGGGAGAVGGNGAASVPGVGGIGLITYSAWALATSTGASGYYAGGGGGSGTSPASAGAGGLGGGGAGSGTTTGTAGTANTGGGGGSSLNTTGATGGSGVVIVRYLI